MAGSNAGMNMNMNTSFKSYASTVVGRICGRDRKNRVSNQKHTIAFVKSSYIKIFSSHKLRF